MEVPDNGVGGNITVPLSSRAATNLARTRERGELNQADIVNRAILFYDFVDEEITAGAELLLRRHDGSTYLVGWI